LKIMLAQHPGLVFHIRRLPIVCYEMLDELVWKKSCQVIFAQYKN